MLPWSAGTPTQHDAGEPQRGKREAANNGQYQQVPTSGIKWHQWQLQSIQSVAIANACLPVKSSQSNVKKHQQQQKDGIVINLLVIVILIFVDKNCDPHFH